ncbi:unnamed protein product, partial [Oppiella nova]
SESYPTGAVYSNDVLDDIEKDINATVTDIDNELAKLSKEGRSSEGTLLTQYKENAHNQIKIIEDNRPLIVPGTLLRAQQLKDGVANEIARLENKPTGADNDIGDDIKKELDVIRTNIRTELAKLEKEGRKAEGATLVQYSAQADSMEAAINGTKVDLLPVLKTYADLLGVNVNDEIKRLEGKPTGADPVDDIHKKVDGIETDIKAELAKLEGEGRAAEGAKLRQYKASADGIEKSLKEARPDVIPVLQSMVDILRVNVDEEIKRLEGKVDPVDAIHREVDRIEVDIRAELAKLADEGSQLREYKKGADDLEVALKDARPEYLPVLQSYAEILRVYVKEEIERLEGKVDPVVRIHEKVDRIEVDIKAELAKLDGEGRQVEGAQLRVYHSSANSLEKSLKEARPDFIPVLQTYADILGVNVAEEIERLEALVSESYPTGAVHSNDVLDDIEKDINATVTNIDNELAKLSKEGRSSEGSLLTQYKENAHNQIKIIEDNRPLIVPGTLLRAQQLKEGVANEIARLENKPTGPVDPADAIYKELDAIEQTIKTELDKLTKEGRATEGAQLEEYQKNAETIRKQVKEVIKDVLPFLKASADILQKDVNTEIKRLESKGAPVG